MGGETIKSNAPDIADSKVLHDCIDDYNPLVGDEQGENVGMRDSCWYKMTWQLLAPRKGLAVLVLVLALCTPICIQCLNQKISISFTLTVPYNSDTYTTFSDVEDGFGAGAVCCQPKVSPAVCTRSHADVYSDFVCGTHRTHAERTKSLTLYSPPKVFPYKLLFVPTSDDICIDDTGDDAAAYSCASLTSLEPNATVSCGLFCQSGFDQINLVLSKLSTIKVCNIVYPKSRSGWRQA